jgi:hypothetical protein
MWPNSNRNSSFGNNGHFQNNFNQDDFPPPSIGVPGAPGQKYFHQNLLQPDMIQFEDATGDGYMNNDFQPELGLHEGSFLQNQFANTANAQVSRARLPSSEPVYKLQVCFSAQDIC